MLISVCFQTTSVKLHTTFQLGSPQTSCSLQCGVHPTYPPSPYPFLFFLSFLSSPNLSPYSVVTFYPVGTPLRSELNSYSFSLLLFLSPPSLSFLYSLLPPSLILPSFSLLSPLMHLLLPPFLFSISLLPLTFHHHPSLSFTLLLFPFAIWLSFPPICHSAFLHP